MTRIESLVCTSLLCLALVGCGSAPSEGVDASVPPDSAVDASAPVDAFNDSVLGRAACEAIAARAAECYPEYVDACTRDAFQAGCERVLVDSSPLRSIRLCVESSACIDGTYETSCLANLQTSASPAPSIDSVIETLCNACPTATAGYAEGVDTAADCEEFVGAAVDGTGTSLTQRALRGRFTLLTEEQLVEIRDCFAADPTCDAYDREACGQRFRDLDMVLTPDFVVPECE